MRPTASGSNDQPPLDWQYQHLTGRVRYRESWLGKMVLQVEVIDGDETYLGPDLGDTMPSGRTGWRDAKRREVDRVRVVADRLMPPSNDE